MCLIGCDLPRRIRMANGEWPMLHKYISETSGNKKQKSNKIRATSGKDDGGMHINGYISKMGVNSLNVCTIY